MLPLLEAHYVIFHQPEWEDFGQMLKSQPYGSNLKEFGINKIQRKWLKIDFLKNNLKNSLKVILEAGDFIRQVHSDSSRIVAVSNKGTLFNVYVENSVVKYTTLKLPGSRGKF